MMECMKGIIDDLMEEVEGAKHYAEKAVKYRTIDRDLAEMFFNMSKQEAGHAENLYAQGGRMMARIQDEDPEAYRKMIWAWEWGHEKMIQGISCAKIMQEMFRG